MASLSQSSMDDCYFYYYSSCTKGPECPFRHCEQALGTETVCSLWKEGRCFRSNCKFRHMESRINRSSIPCYWENQPGGCKKPHCVFLHRKLKNGNQYIKPVPGLILPTCDGKTSPKLTEAVETTLTSNKSPPKENLPDGEEDYVPNPSSVPVTPLVLSFDEGEESDTESVSSTPIKMSSGNSKVSSGLARNNLTSKFSAADKEKDFGIKTLEQIRMEKIHKESDSFYSTDDTAGNISLECNPNPTLLKEGFFCHSAYDVPILDAPQAVEQLNKEYYPPKSDFLSISRDSLLEKSQPLPLKETKLGGLNEQNDLRDKISNRRNSTSNVSIAKRLTNFKKQNKLEENSNSLDFKIKTLEEIRREKKSKQDHGDASVNNTPIVSCPSIEDKSNSSKVTKKLKITRKPKELYTMPPICKTDTTLGSIEQVASQMVSNGFKNACDELKQSNKVTVLPNSSGKRKIELDTTEKENKHLKLDTSSDINKNTDVSIVESGIGNKENEQKYAMKSLQPFIHHSKLLVSLSTPAIPDTTNNAILSNNSTSPNGNLNDSESDVSKEINSKTNVELNQYIHVNSSVSVNTLKNELNSEKEIKQNNFEKSMSVDDFEHLLEDDDMNIEEIETSPDDDILLEVEQFLDS